MSNVNAYFHVSGSVLQSGQAAEREQGERWPKEKLNIQRRLHKRHVALNRALERYTFRPRATYIISGHGWLFGLVPDENKRWFQVHIDGQTITEADAALSTVRLAATGDLWKVRLCEMCKDRWRLGAKRNYRFCSAHCRETFYAKAPEYHSRKAANQRKYRENLKRQQVAQDAIRNRG